METVYIPLEMSLRVGCGLVVGESIARGASSAASTRRIASLEPGVK